jgi:dynactin 1
MVQLMGNNTCPDLCGIFVKQSNVTKRTLSRLEELRLRRELNSAAPASTTTTELSSSTTTSATPSRLPSATSASSSMLKSPSPSIATTKTTTPSVSSTPRVAATPISSSTSSDTGSSALPSASGHESASASKNKLEELRKRRAMLNQKRDGGGSAIGTTETTSAAPSTTGSTAALRPTDSFLSISRSTSNVSDDLDSHATSTGGGGGGGTVSDVGSNRYESGTEQQRLLVNTLNDKLASQENEIIELKQKLNESVDSSKSKIQQLESTVAELQKKNQAAAEAITKTVSPSKLAASYALPDDIQQQIMALESKNLDLIDKLEETVTELSNVRREYDIVRKSRINAVEELSTIRIELTTYQNQIQAMTDQSTARGQSDATHYKERAKLQAEISNYKRKIDVLEKEKMELENTVEDVTLDKEQLLEEKEALEDRYEELKLDAETAQMEVEELKIELEDARASAERIFQGQQQGIQQISSSTNARTSSSSNTDTSAPDMTTTATGRGIDEKDVSLDDKSNDNNDDDEIDTAEMAQALQVQNARLREALIRLREQSQVEKMELTRQLRSIEKQAQSANDIQNDYTKLQELIATQDEQINDLKDMVEQGAAFEMMVEDLSDRVMSLEEDNIMLQAVIREMEEAAELTAEMEEVQGDEIKALTIELESHKVIIRNLEEAIKIQRRREDDFRRTVGNYKTTVDTLKQEKNALLELQQGDEGVKVDAIAASQKALAKAAQWVADAAATRKREAAAAYNTIERIIASHTSNRIEQLLPHNISVIAVETGAIRGELLGAKVIGIASKSLEGIESSFIKAIRPALPFDDESGAVKASSNGVTVPKLTDENKQHISTMFHQIDFAHLLVDVSSDILRLLVAGQWPDLLTPEASLELGNILGSTLPDLATTIHGVLKSVKEEGALTVDQSNIGTLTLIVQNTMQSLKSNLERDDQTIIPSTWYPPGWQLIKNASMTKFSCQGIAAALSSIVITQSENITTTSSSTIGPLATLYNRIEQCSSQASNICQRLATLDLKNEKLVNTLHDIVAEAKDKANLMDKSIQSLLLNSNAAGTVDTTIMEMAESTVRILTKLLSVLRGSGMNVNEPGRYHPLSPEIGDAWNAISTLTCKIRSIDGDSDDINYIVRSQKIESQINTAIDNEPKLVLANQKLALLEKNLSNRSKEIAMQNARLSELEKIVAKTSSGGSNTGSNFGRGKTLSSADLRSSEEYINLKEENRVVRSIIGLFFCFIVVAVRQFK